MTSKDPEDTGSPRSETGSWTRWSLWVGVAALILGTGATGCAEQGPAGADLTSQQEAALADTIATVNQNLVTVWSELEPEAYLELVSDDVLFSFHRWFEGESYREAVRQFMAAHRSNPIEITDSEVEVLGPEAGVVTGSYSSQAVDTAGQSETLNGAFTFVYERRDGEWLLVRGHESVLPEESNETGS